MPYEQLCNVQVLMHNNAKTAQIEKKGHQICLAFCAILHWDILGHEFFRDLCDLKAELQKKPIGNYAFIYEIRCTAQSIYKHIHFMK